MSSLRFLLAAVLVIATPESSWAQSPTGTFSVRWSIPTTYSGFVGLTPTGTLAVATWSDAPKFGLGRFMRVEPMSGNLLVDEPSGSLERCPPPFRRAAGAVRPFVVGDHLMFIDGAGWVRTIPASVPNGGSVRFGTSPVMACRAVGADTVAVAQADGFRITRVALVDSSGVRRRSFALPVPSEDWTFAETFGSPPRIVICQMIQTETTTIYRLRCFSLLDGRPVWTSEDLSTHPIVNKLGADTLCVAADRQIRVMDARRGRVLWNHPLQGVGATARAAGADVLAFDSSGVRQGRLRLLDGESGQVRWTVQLGARWPEVSGLSLVVRKGSAIFAAFKGGTLACLSAIDGAVRAVGAFDQSAQDLLPLSERSIVLKTERSLMRLELSDTPPQADRSAFTEVWRSSHVNFRHGEVLHIPDQGLVSRRAREQREFFGDSVDLVSDYGGRHRRSAGFLIGLRRSVTSDGVNLWGIVGSRKGSLDGWIPAADELVPYIPDVETDGAESCTAAHGLLALRRAESIDAWSTGRGDPTTSGMTFLWSRPVESFSKGQVELIPVQNGASSDRFVLKASAAVMAVEGRTGKVAWRRPTVIESVEQASLVDGVLALRGQDGRVEALDLASGQTKWRLEGVASLFGARTGRFVAAFTDGRRATVSPADGRLGPLPTGLDALGRLVGCTEELLLVVAPDGCLVAVRPAEDRSPRRE